MDMITAYGPQIITLAFSPSGNALALLSTEGVKQTLEIWNVRQHTSCALAHIDDLEDVPWLETDEDVPEAQLCWSSDDAYLALVRSNGAVDVWHVLESKHLFSSQLGESCRVVAWGNVHPCLAVGSVTKLLYWRHLPYHPIEPSVRLIQEEKEMIREERTTRFFRPRALTFSPDDRFLLAGGGWGGRAMYWVVSPYELLGTFSFQVPSQLPIVDLFYSPDGTSLLIEQYDKMDCHESKPLRARSLYMQRTHNWLVFGQVEQDCIGWSADSQRLLGTRQEIGGPLWLEQRHAWTGDEVGKTPINASEIDLETLSLTGKGTQVSWATRRNTHAFSRSSLAIDFIPL